jgi:formylglycine-generating enzyme required for sulfatase activity
MSFKKSAFIVLIVTALLTTGLPTYAQRLALVIGNSAYRDDGILSNPVNDAKDLAKVLRRLGFEVIHRQNLNHRKMVTVIKQFGKKLRRNKGVGLFYFSGHGAQHHGENYLIPIGAPNALNSVDLLYSTVAAGYVLDTMKAAKNEINLIFLDACRSRPKKHWFKGEKMVSGLAPMLTVPDSLISYAASPGGVAKVGKGRNSPYVKHLMKLIQEPYLSINEVLTKVRRAVIKDTENVQFPGFYNALNDDFYFAKVFRDRLQDGSKGPEMVWIPAGTFRMGDIQGGGESDEKPVHSVSVNRFAMGRYEVTFAEYDKFAQATGRENPSDNGWGRGNRPVINVSWHDATAYTEWLSQQTGEQYRLPTEAEWEYAARAGTETKYWWGNDIGKNRAAYNGCGTKWGWDAKKMTAPIGSFQPNPFGLYDTVGNVWEWTCSEYEDKYKGKEKQCLSKNHANNNFLVLRGGSWLSGPGDMRSAGRYGWRPAGRARGGGFRLARS